MVNIIKDKKLILDVFDYDVIIVGTGIDNSLRGGFQRDIRLNFNEVERANKSTRYDDTRKLGTVRVVKTTPIFCLSYIHKKNFRPDLEKESLNYEALEKCFELLFENFKDKKIATTLIGCSRFDGNGDKNKVMDIINRHFSKYGNITIYDYEQLSDKEEESIMWKKVKSYIGTEQYREEKKKYIWKNSFGIYTPMPDLSENEIKKIIKDYNSKKWES